MMSSKAPSETCLLLNVGVVAPGSSCLSVIKNFQVVDPSRLRLRLVAIATTQESALCHKYAKKMGIEVFSDYHDLLSIDYLNLILELTGDNAILSDIISRKRPSMGVLDRHAAMLLMDVALLFAQVDRREAEITLATSFASSFLDASPDGVLVIDREYRIINYNKSPLIPGSDDREALLGKYCFEVMDRTLSPCGGLETGCPAHESQKGGKPARTVHEVTGSNNSTQICQVTCYPIFNQYGEVSQYVLAIRDMTKDLGERIERRTQTIKKDLARAAQEDRLTSLGRLVASVCHEINNPITSIVTFTKLVLSMIRKGDLSSEEIANVERYLDLSFREAMRCGGIVKNLLTFARPKSVEARNIDIPEVVNTIRSLTDHQFELSNVRCVVTLPSSPFAAWGDYTQIQQCLLNLIFNAIDAMPGGGTITISGGTDEDADLIWLAVSDTGQGIESNDLQRIFEPFYSTKTEGKGVGLGLSMVYGIIHEHNGIIEVDSEPGKGTTFRIKLPRSPVNGREGEQIRNRTWPAVPLG
jgi:two-component system, NtrC family, sensor kinase